MDENNQGLCAMNNTKYLSLLSLAATGLLCGTTEATAAPLLDSDLASFTAFGAAAETPISTGAIGSNGGDWSGGGTNTASGFNASPVAVAQAAQTAGGFDGAGISVAQLAQALHRPAITAPDSLRLDVPATNPDLEGLVFGPGVNDDSAEQANPNGAPTGNDKDTARANLCETGIALLDQERLADICKDIPALNNDLDAASRPAYPANDGSNGNSGSHPGPSIAGSPGSAIAAAFFPSALAAESVPEPAMLALLAAGLVGLGFSRPRNTQGH